MSSGPGARRASGYAASPGEGEHTAIVLAQAREMIAANERLDMARLSAELGVDRTTLFRWVGNRDRLLVEVVASIVDALLEECIRGAGDEGGGYVADVLGRWVQAMHGSPELRAVLTRDPDRALRLIASPAGEIHRRLVARLTELLGQEQDAGCLPHPTPLPDLAEALVRLAGAHVWIDVPAGTQPQPAAVRAATALVLRP